MEFIRFSLPNIDGEAVEAISEVFEKYGYGGPVVESRPPDLHRYTISTLFASDDPALVQRVEQVLEMMAELLPGGLPQPIKETVAANAWVETWKETFQVIRIGPRVVIQPTWRDHTPQPNDVVIQLDPGAAFGSGLHPTTRLCLELLQTMNLTNQALFDVGTGSGILSIAAAKLGANLVRAVDVDPIAVRVAQENFSLNNLANHTNLETAVGSAGSTGGRTWPLVVANILAHILIEIMADLKAALTPDGRLILSGIINEQEAALLNSLAQHQLSIHSRHTEGDWIAFVVGRR